MFLSQVSTTTRAMVSIESYNQCWPVFGLCLVPYFSAVSLIPVNIQMDLTKDYPVFVVVCVCVPHIDRRQPFQACATMDFTAKWIIM